MLTRSSPHRAAFLRLPIPDGLDLDLLAAALDACTITLPHSGLVRQRVASRMTLRRPARAA